MEFQSTRPARGATTMNEMQTYNSTISIHAPREGRDEFPQCRTGNAVYFNPRAPRGARRLELLELLQHLHISIHAPREGRDVTGNVGWRRARAFQSTRPARGATCMICATCSARSWKNFNPRAPRGARQHNRCVYMAQVVISIHAPREGRDRLYISRIMMEKKFQSTRPARGATKIQVASGGLKAFQSTRPARGATENPFDGGAVT